MILYDIITTLSENGYTRIRTNLIAGNLQIAKTKIIENGKQLTDTFTANGETYTFDALTGEKQNICDLYAQFKTSLPGEGDNKFQTFFRAKSADELTDEELITGIPRTEARIKLESYLILASVEGKIKWQNENHWYELGCTLMKDEFPNTEPDKDFIILKKMIERTAA